MLRTHSLVPVFLAVLAAIAFVGCGSESTPPSPNVPGQKTTIEQELAKLPPEERKAAREQIICPVSGKPLGSMEGMKKVAVKDREVFICCEGCEAELKKDPKPYLDLLADIQMELGKLSKEDQEIALNQRICPVSDKALGSMTGLKKVQIEGKEVFLCCSSCKAKLEANPQEYLKKLKQ